jgi:hypothetical protein
MCKQDQVQGEGGSPEGIPPKPVQEIRLRAQEHRVLGAVFREGRVTLESIR